MVGSLIATSTRAPVINTHGASYTQKSFLSLDLYFMANFASLVATWPPPPPPVSFTFNMFPFRLMEGKKEEEVERKLCDA